MTAMDGAIPRRAAGSEMPRPVTPSRSSCSASAPETREIRGDRPGHAPGRDFQAQTVERRLAAMAPGQVPGPQDRVYRPVTPRSAAQGGELVATAGQSSPGSSRR